VAKHREEAEKAMKEAIGLREFQKLFADAEVRIKNLQEEITNKTRAYVKLQEEVIVHV
jgi:hypothetical protein